MRGDPLADHCLIDQASAMFLDALPRRLSFADAAKALGMKVRDLEAAYARRGLHPRQHMRALRMARLHADLAAGRYDTVGQALARWGFPTASSDVARDYQARYGVMPDQTLELARSR